MIGQLIYQIFVSKNPDLQKIRDMGLLAVKIGQVYALRADFIGVDRATKLKQLYEKNYDRQNQVELIYSLPNELKENLDLSDSQIVAEASIGQVWSASYAGKEVVLKIVKKDFLHSFERDVARAKRFARLCIFFYPKLKRVADPVGTLEDIERMTKNELNLTNEISGQDELKKIYQKDEDFLKKNTTHSFYFHKIYSNLSSREILVSECIDGKSFNELLEGGELPYDALLDFFFLHVFGMLHSGVFHEDIHPGNIFLTTDNQIALLDTGSIGHASKQLRENLYAMFVSLVNQNYQQAAKDITNMSINKEVVGEKKCKKFEEKFCDLYKDFAGKSLSEVSLTSQMMKSIKLAVRSGYEFERSMYPVIKAFMYLDGMASRCRPDTDLMEDIRPLIKKFENYK